MGVGVGWGGVLTFMLRWWCYADHRTFWLSCSDGTQGRPCWKQLALLCRRDLARVEDKKNLIFGKTVCSSRRANGICENEVQTHGKNGTFWTQVPSRPFKYIAKRSTESLRLISKWANNPGSVTRPQPSLSLFKPTCCSVCCGVRTCNFHYFLVVQPFWIRVGRCFV